jgi:hypothetical protein
MALTNHALLKPRLGMGRAIPPHPLSVSISFYGPTLSILPLPLHVITVSIATKIINCLALAK